MILKYHISKPICLTIIKITKNLGSICHILFFGEKKVGEGVRQKLKRGREGGSGKKGRAMEKEERLHVFFFSFLAAVGTSPSTIIGGLKIMKKGSRKQ